MRVWKPKITRQTVAPTVRYVIVRRVHPMLKATNGYYAIHGDKVWHWVKTKEKATTFPSHEKAMMCAKGSNLECVCYYQIERL